MKSNTKTIVLVTVIFFIIIISGILTLYYLKNTSEELEFSIKTAGVCVSNNQWEEASKHLDDFEKIWEKTKFGWAILIDHFEIDNIDNSFIKSRKYIESQDYSSALAELDALKQYIKHIPKRESFSLENIF